MKKRLLLTVVYVSAVMTAAFLPANSQTAEGLA